MTTNVRWRFECTAASGEKRQWVLLPVSSTYFTSARIGIQSVPIEPFHLMCPR